jgi:hypothetical protein
MTRTAQVSTRRLALATLLAALVCALGLLPALRSEARSGLDHVHAVAATHQHVQAVQRAAEPDLAVAETVAAPHLTVMAVVTSAAEIDSSPTVDSARTRGPPAKAVHQPALSL